MLNYLALYRLNKPRFIKPRKGCLLGSKQPRADKELTSSVSALDKELISSLSALNKTRSLMYLEDHNMRS